MSIYSLLKKTKGFTLIELLIVIAIIAILTVAFLPTLRGGQAKARDASRKTLINNLVVAFENLVNDARPLPQMPTGGGSPGGTAVCLGSTTNFLWTETQGKAVSAALGRVPQAFPAITGAAPHLCVEGKFVYYKLFTGGSSYILAVEVENADNANVTSSATAATLELLTGVSGALGLQESSLPTVCSSTSSCFYMVAK